MTPDSIKADIAALERQAIEAAQQGRLQQAVDTWARIVSLQPNHVTGLTQLGQAAFNQRDFHAARVAFERVTRVDGQQPRQWINLARVCQQLQDDAAQETALFKALTLDPYDLLALLLRGQLYERQGKSSQASSSYGAAATVAPPLDRLSPDLQTAVTHAMGYVQQYQQSLAAFLDRVLEPHLQDCGPAGLDRFKLSLDMLVGRKQRFDPQPMRYYLPQLPVIEFFDRATMPWLDPVEAAWEAVRDEFLAVLRTDQGFTPYIDYSADQPVAQWAELNHSPRWNAFHLVKDGHPVPVNAARCPATMAVWADTPWPDQPGRTPVSLYSTLKPHTRIPGHVGASNCRLVMHLPLIVPPGCRFRVGNDVREWVPGKAWAFDDTIEHEAWNDSDQLRAVWIFDTWHPMLNAAERRMITALNSALHSFSGESTDQYDA